VAFAGSFVLVFHHDSSIYQSFQVIVRHSDQIGLQVFLKSIHEAFPLLLIHVNVIRGIPPPSGELVEVLRNTHPTLLEVEELVTHNLDKSGGNVGFAELGLESIPSHHLAFGLHGTDIFPPCTRCSSQEVSGVEHLFILSNSRILEFVLDGAEPVVGIKGFSRLGEGWWVGVLEVPKLAAGLIVVIATTVVVVGGNLCEVLKSGKVGLTLGASGFAVL
jgi:hypothetical protein